MPRMASTRHNLSKRQKWHDDGCLVRIPDIRTFSKETRPGKRRFLKRASVYVNSVEGKNFGSFGRYVFFVKFFHGGPVYA